MKHTANLYLACQRFHHTAPWHWDRMPERFTAVPHYSCRTRDMTGLRGAKRTIERFNMTLRAACKTLRRPRVCRCGIGCRCWVLPYPVAYLYRHGLPDGRHLSSHARTASALGRLRNARSTFARGTARTVPRLPAKNARIIKHRQLFFLIIRISNNNRHTARQPLRLNNGAGDLFMGDRLSCRARGGQAAGAASPRTILCAGAIIPRSPQHGRISLKQYAGAGRQRTQPLPTHTNAATTWNAATATLRTRLSLTATNC